MLRPLFHLSVAAINTLVMWYDQTYITFPFTVKAMEGYPLKSRSMFLTIWCLILQTVYHFVAFLNDVVGTNVQSPKKTPIIRQIKDTLFSIAFPTAIYVSLAFWSIYAIDKELIFPERIEKLYHPALNHVMHTTVSVFIIIELFTSYRNYPSRKLGYIVTYLFYVSYLVWFFVVYAQTGAWVYPVFEPLNWPLRFLFIALSLSIATGLYIFGEKVNNFVCKNLRQPHTNGVTNGTAKSKKKS
ncbi:androgen-dependent TFPI-regulating protein-like [Maniola hyperantus]|uniref:androgen-dependent TFPI-regulating protein-like n=1 Tax=Aphantopus hyperantus TaxID=2795564 RepID=UPI0015695EE6|nr:androgen-dependent TFPI-regulating protein-like [Maniola hyperantus]